jgi:uncharacterized membrane protein
MSWYELLLFLHIVAVIVWLGAGVLIDLLSIQAERAGDSETLKRVADDADRLGFTLFMPSALATLVFGILLTIEGPWGLDQLWIVLGLAGFLATFLVGLFVMKPGGERILAIVERDGGFSDAAMLETRRLMTKSKVDTLVLFLVVAIMVIKPTGDDVGVLAVLAAAVVAGLAYIAAKLRALDAETAAPAAVVGS